MISVRDSLYEDRHLEYHLWRIVMEGCYGSTFRPNRPQEFDDVREFLSQSFDMWYLSENWVYISIQYAPNGHVNGDNDHQPLELGVAYFQSHAIRLGNGNPWRLPQKAMAGSTCSEVGWPLRACCLDASMFSINLAILGRTTNC